MRFTRPNKFLRSCFSDYIWSTRGAGILITIDDGPSQINTASILRELDKSKCTALFFCSGESVLRGTELVKSVFEAGHEIGNHGFRHQNQLLFSRSQLTDSIRRTNDLISDITGAPVKYYRPPHGYPNLWLSSVLKKEGLKNIMWSLMPYDFEGKLSLSSSILTKQINKDDIIVFHDNEKSRDVFPVILSSLINLMNLRQFKLAEPQCLN